MNTSTLKRNVTSLEDRYTAADGWHYMTGLQALVRLPIQQRLRDEAIGWNTGGFISGYRGSPLGRYDIELWQAAKELNRHNIVFQPGVNEDLAATATWGSQMVGLFPGATVEGVFSIWYGKAPGMDRSMDPIRHANLAGVNAKGGTLLIVGDDHGAKSSTLACYSDYNFISAGIPLFYPSNAQEVLDYGLHAIAMSRHAGCVAGMKLVTDVVEGGGSVHVAPDAPAITLPAHRLDANIRVFTPLLEQERLLFNARLDNALDYARLNRLNHITSAAPGAKVGIIAAGKAWQDLAQGLRELGVRDGAFDGGSVRLLKIALLWPLDNAIIEDFAQGLDTIIVVEEKRPLLEDQIRSILYGRANAPTIVGKYFEGRPYQTDKGEIAFPNDGETNPDMVARIVARVLRQSHPDCGVALRNAPAQALGAAGAARPPTFCAGCPHGRSTLLPEGSRALAGIGCHSIALARDPMRTNSISHMGGEGVMWIGQKPFTNEKHVFTNMGDGTYFHSGLLAIRAAVAANVPITYKLLHNGFVSMTGGQPVDGEISPERMIEQLLAEGVTRIAVVADDPGKYAGKRMANGVTLHPRIELTSVQKELREYPSVSVILYDQACATERRRLRKRGKWPDPDKRVFINAAVCEGCGDCSTISQCMAIEPLETEYGRKRVINQSSCNKDFSCVEGFCPSFVTVRGARPRVAAARSAGAVIDAEQIAAIPAPTLRPIEGSAALLVAGIGGAGVVTIGQTLAVAAHVDGLYSSNLDVTGLSQKYGAVHSHVKIANRPEDLFATRIASGEANAVIGCDLIVAASADTLSKLNQENGGIVADASLTPTSEFSKNPDWRINSADLVNELKRAAPDRALTLNASNIATKLFGDAIYMNIVLLGASWQTGVIPLSHDALMRAIELNGVNVARNKQAFEIGRLAAHDPAKIETMLRAGARGASPERERTLEDIIADRRRVLTDYKDSAYADRYERAVRAIAAAEARLHAGDALARAAAHGYFKLLAHKDEWEVARLYTQPAFREQLTSAFEGDLKLTFHVGAWPFGRFDEKAGTYVKGEVGPWLMPLFGIMARLRGLRGSWLDPFKNNAEAKLAARLLAEYEADLAFTQSNLSPGALGEFTSLLSLPEKIRGYGHVRQRHADEAAQERARLLAKLREPQVEAA
ncbi:MAG: indolepyruvate ferredoxin oxidoreductase [Chloroflexota bacterium]|nr:indolepyruvate ferredoxin oxidoreductase family protein [Hyphomonadaceae bacterium]GIK76295.1 MAG: indolepyruvate ferredoxin oxidoreductase [Chloroflexota bacterium]